MSVSDYYLELLEQNMRRTDEIVKLQFELHDTQIKNLQKRLDDMIDLMTRLTPIIDAIQTNIKTNNDGLHSLYNDFKRLKESMPEHKPRKNFPDLFNI